MSQTARAHRYRLAYGKQSAEGTAQSTPAYEVNIYTGSIRPVNVEEDLEMTDTDDLPVGTWIAMGASDGNPQIPGDPEATGFGWNSLLGSDTVTGSGANRVHTIVKSDTKPWNTFYQMRPGVVGGTDIWSRAVDVFIKQITVDFEKGRPIRHTWSLIGKTHEFNVSVPTPTNDKRVIGANFPLLTMIGSTWLLDLDTTPAATAIHNIRSGSITVGYPNASIGEDEQTDGFNPTFITLGDFEIAMSLEAIVQDYTALSSTFWGTKTIGAAATPGTALSPVAVMGALDVTFPVRPTADANRLEQIQLPSIRFKATPPEPDPSGKAALVTLVGKAYKPSSGQVITVISKNGSAGY